MNLLITTNEELRQYIANVVHEVDDETLLYDKMIPWLEQAQQSVTNRYVGDISLDGDCKRAACTLIAITAFYHAIPSLDLVVTPNGFGVVSSTNIAPASKERVERLRASLLEAIDTWSDNLLFALSLNEEWLASDASAPFRRTLLTKLDDAVSFKRDNETLYDAFMRVQPYAISFEHTIESEYLGASLMAHLHSLADVKSNPEYFAICESLRQIEIRWISVHHRDRGLTCPKQHELWHLIQPVLKMMRSYPDIYSEWYAEMSGVFTVPQSDVLPSKQGGCWL